MQTTTQENPSGRTLAAVEAELAAMVANYEAMRDNRNAWRAKAQELVKAPAMALDDGLAFKIVNTITQDRGDEPIPQSSLLFRVRKAIGDVRAFTQMDERQALANVPVLAEYEMPTAAAVAGASEMDDETRARGERLMEEIESSMASPVAQALGQHILNGEKEAALALMSEERMSTKDALALYDYSRQKWLGWPISLVEVPVVYALDAIKKAYADTPGDDRPRFVIRRGLTVTPVHVYENDRGIEFYLPSQGVIPFNSIQQLWRIVPKVR